jgi:hypothetical protein
MNAADSLNIIECLQWIQGIKFLILKFLIPIAVAVVTYIIVDRLGEWRRRRMYSRLGVAIIESLQEEIRHGIEVMTDALNATEDNNTQAPPPALPPHMSWSGMTTIPDEVLLRIIETSAGRQFDGFPPRECRIHCKNYFEHMRVNYTQTLDHSLTLARQEQDWRGGLRALLADDANQYIQAARRVNQMLEHTRQLLEENSRATFPK